MKRYSEMKEAFAHSRFRSRFHLTEKDRAYIAARGWDVLREQTRSIVLKRLASENPENDGSQTPVRGHVVFTAQHATATCCRGCLEKWHCIPKGRALSDRESESVVSMILDWLKDRAGDLSKYPRTPDLFEKNN